MVNNLDECLKRMARSQNNNGRRMNGDDALKDGAEIFRKRVLSEENPLILSRQQTADTFVDLHAVKTPDEARKILDQISHLEIHYGGEGYIYLEKVRGKIALGYSPYK